MLRIEQSYIAETERILTTGRRKALNNPTSDNSYILSCFGAMLRHNFTEGFPIYSSKKVLWKKAIAEMLWFLNPKDCSGTLDVTDLQAMGVNIWNDWAGDGPNIPVHYGNSTNWAGTGLDQTEWAIEGLLTKPFRKCYKVSNWDPSTVYQMADQSGKTSVVLPACHTDYQLLCNEPNKLSMMLNIRSNDWGVGNPLAYC